MASLVTATKIEATSGTSVSSSTFSATAGNALVCCSVCSATSGSATTTGGGGTWTKDATGVSSAGSLGLDISSAPNVTGGTSTITLTYSVATNGLTVIIQEWNGLPSSSMRDNTSPAMTHGTTTTVTTGSLSNVSTNAVYVAVMGDNSGANPATVTGTTSGWTYNPNSTDEKNGVSFMVAGTGYDIVSSVASRTSSWTIDAGATDWAGLIAVYKQASAPAFTPPLPFTTLQAIKRASYY